MPISFQFGLRTSVWIGPVYLDAPIGQILWCVWVEEVGRNFRHAFQVRDTSLKRNTAGEMFAAFLLVVFSGTVSTSWRGWPQLIASWWPHGHCLQAELVKLQGELQRFTPARPSIRVQAMAGQTVLSN